MNNSSNMSSNGDKGPFHKPIIYTSRAKSLIAQNSRNSSTFNNNEVGKNVTTVMDKIKRLFSNKNMNEPTTELNRTKLKEDRNNNEDISTPKTLKPLPLPMHDQKVEWQPVYHETCKIKLPVEENNQKISLPEYVIDDWVYNQNKISKNLGSSSIKYGENGTMIDDCFNNNKNNENKNTGKKNNNDDNNNNNNNNNNTNGGSSNCYSNCNDEEENYSNFKYHYNYYLVDEYLESLVESQNKILDATGLDEQGQLYENVCLNVKPIIISKQRLESGVPYDPSKLMN
ncbi:hypothetical protein CYL21_4202 [Plasmodium falciparum NF54]|uniref:Uncharacterized protein n=4 Tax=Plasmodium falciparum TaxID=5833 RepID=C6KSQ5_PLAF7|nr:conserved Plasmodium protein, unknown function [Plasmodium falciparum 3D7]ETW27314.1 hypothetical protein PFFCH_05245 [Plasmodium falciparum FCH/4]KAF4327558.1 hypothetical protein CYL21_4202 [Plasmodium falciparum NF54]PKC43002.1 hypothetical protein CK202_5022 [Plasmodium falciparum NF54]CAG25227.1 conserved Plasmodium protein, unknown function [Plasmodium falciparum 3D7]|eukprot:XP_966047.1 conserved Plasmodium protein, unknown function [Plasmodium falciparum 3D7]